MHLRFKGLLTTLYLSCRASEGVHVNTQYRQFVPPPRFAVVIGEAASGFMWFWILWRFWHDPDEVLVRAVRLETTVKQ